MTSEEILGTFDISTDYRGEVKAMPTKVKELRVKAGWTAFQLAVAADVSIATVNRFEKDKNSVQPLTAYKVLNALAKKLGQRIELEDIEDGE